MSEKHKQDLLNRIRKKKLVTNVSKDDESAVKTETKKIGVKKEIDKDWLTKKALEEIERTASFHKVKRESFGTTSEPKSKANKKFLATTISHAISHNRRVQNIQKHKSTSKLQELEKYRKLRSTPQKFGTRTHHFKKPEKKIILSSDDDHDDKR